MNKYLSDKLKAISFILMIMVVIIHSYNLEINFSSHSGIIKRGYNSFIQDIISKGLTRVAVPLFFLISGYLFFLTIKNGTINDFLSKYKKRCKTLVLPYLLWSIFGVLIYLILQSIPFSKPFFTKELIYQYSTNQLLYRIFIDPIPYQLWFMRDLIVLIILSPILYFFVKQFKFYIISLFFITWIISFDYVVFSSESLLFFAFGALLSIENINIQKEQLNNKYLIFIITWITLIIVKTILVYNEFKNDWLILIIYKSSILFGIISVWLFYDIRFRKRDISQTKFYLLFQYTFFLYAFHEPMLTILKKAFYFILGQSELSSFLIYILAPFITIIVCILTGYFLKQRLPKFYLLLTGGR